MHYKRAEQTDDFLQIVTLQNKNLITTLNATEQSDGFLSAQFSVEQLEAMNNDLCVMTCFDDDYLCAYLCASTIAFNMKFPLLAAMIHAFSNITYKNKPLMDYKAFIYGPVCIDKDYRGKGILTDIFSAAIHFLSKKSDPPNLLTALIANENQRSLHAHTTLGMEVVGEFEFKAKTFSILVLPI